MGRIGHRFLPETRTLGFTLLELLLVLLILGVLGLAVSPSLMSALAKERLKAGAGGLADAFAYARILAVSNERVYGVDVDVDGNWYRVFDNDYKENDPNTSHHDDDPPVHTDGLVQQPISKDWYKVDLDSAATSDGVEITAGPDGNEVLFHPDGHTSSAVDQTCTLSCGGYTLDLTIKAGTGRVVIQ